MYIKKSSKRSHLICKLREEREEEMKIWWNHNIIFILHYLLHIRGKKPIDYNESNDKNAVLCNEFLYIWKHFLTKYFKVFQVLTKCWLLTWQNLNRNNHKFCLRVSFSLVIIFKELALVSQSCDYKLSYYCSINEIIFLYV